MSHKPGPQLSVDREVRTFSLFMSGRPYTRQEPLRSRQGRMYPHPQTVIGLREWVSLWSLGGRPHVEGPIIVEIYVRVNRPSSHLNRAGEPNSTGKKFLIPPGFDLSNVVKLVEDALKHRGFGDDSLVASLHATKQWSTLRRPAGVEVSVSKFGVGAPE